MLYIETLIGPNTITTVPPETLRLFEDHGVVEPTLPGDVAGAERTMSELERGGIDFTDVNRTLEDEGIAKFSRSFEKLIRIVGEKRQSLTNGSPALSTNRPRTKVAQGEADKRCGGARHPAGRYARPHGSTRAVTITHIFFDVGGVLGTSGWNTAQRAAAVDRFELDAAEFDRRHDEAVTSFEEGRITLDAYLDRTVFYESRNYTREEFKSFMLAQSAPFVETIAIARELADSKHYRLMTINNESSELNVHRLRLFGLVDIFSTFFSSCWLGVTKPAKRIYELALTLTQANPAHSLFIDDREQNLPPARALGMHTVRYVSPAQLVRDLAAHGVLSPHKRD